MHLDCLNGCMIPFRSAIRRHVLTALVALLSATIVPRLGAVYIAFDGDNPALPTQATPGSSITLFLQDVPSSGTQYQWLFNDTPVVDATSPDLQLDNLSTFFTGNYRLKVVYPSGTAEYSDTLALNVVSPPPSPVDPSFAARLPTNVANARPVAVLADGRILVSCVLTGESTDPTTGFSPAYYRLKADGSLDSSFVFPRTAGAVLATADDGSMLTANAPYRLNADASANIFALPTGFDVSKPLAAAVIQSDGKFLIAQGIHLARLNSDGTLDSAFSYANTRGATIDWLKIDLLGRILVHGLVTETAPLYPPAHSYATIERLTTTGGKDSTFSGPPLPYAFSPYYLDYMGFYSLTAGGYVVMESTGGYLDGSVARLRDDGSLDMTWSSNVHMIYGAYLAVDPAGRLFTADADTVLHRYTVTTTSLDLDTSFYPGKVTSDAAPVQGVTRFLLGQVMLQPDGQLLVGGEFDRWDGHGTPRLARIRSTDITTAAPSAACGSTNYYPHHGETVTLGCFQSGFAPGPLTYQWLALDGQPLPANTTSANLVIASFTAANLGRYQARVTGPGGTVLATPVTINVSGLPVYLSNLSGRAMTGTGENTVIAGLTTNFAVKGLLRGAGPSLATLGVSNALPNPIITLFSSSGTTIGGNDNWGDAANPTDITALANRAGAFAFANGSLDAAAIIDFVHGGYTVHLADRNGASGVGLLEIYADPSDPAIGNFLSPLTNLSFRARTGPGEATAIAGFVIVDPLGLGRPLNLLLRAIGPTLTTQGVANPLENPVITVFNSKGDIVATNDDWSANNTSANPTVLAATMKNVGAFDLPVGSKDSALLLDLPAGAYTMHATGGTGVVLLEIYLAR
jgi:uncharacterized delta-60 repeat protein